MKFLKLYWQIRSNLKKIVKIVHLRNKKKNEHFFKTEIKIQKIVILDIPLLLENKN